MESMNPFIQRIHVASKQLEKYKPITSEDVERYPLRGQNYKFTHPEQFTFIDMPVEFIAMEVDDETRVRSMLLYVDGHETMLETLTIAYGKPAVSLDIKGQAEYESGESQPQSYTSHTWMLEGYRLTLTILPVKTSQMDTALRAQLYIQ